MLMALSLLAISCSVMDAQSYPAASTMSTSKNLLTPRMRAAFLQQIATEQYSANLYLTFASYFGDLGLDGCEGFFRASAKEEGEHALLFYNLLVDRGEKFQLSVVNAVDVMPTSPLDAFVKHLENEIRVTTAIHNLYAIAVEEQDFASQAFLYPFLLLQVQEEKEAQDMVQLLEQGGDNPAFLLVFDNKLKEAAE